MAAKARTYGEFIEFYKDKNEDELTWCAIKELSNITDNDSDEIICKQINESYIGMYKNFNVLNNQIDRKVNKNNECIYKILEIVLGKKTFDENQKIKVYHYNNKEVYEVLKKDGIVKIKMTESGLEKEVSDFFDRLNFIKILNEENDLHILNPKLNKHKGANQKWHFFIAYLANKMICTFEKDTDKLVDINNIINYTDIKSPILYIWMIENIISQENDEKKVIKLKNIIKKYSDKERTQQTKASFCSELKFFFD